MKQKELAQEVFNLLRPYQDPRFPLAPYSLVIVRKDKLDSLYQIIKDDSGPRASGEKPLCPVIDNGKTLRAPTIHYKQGVIEYLHRHGFPFQPPDYVMLMPSTLEAMLNYLHRKK